MEEHSIVGLSIGVVHGTTSHTYGYGTTNFDNDIPVTGKTFFNVASITKLFTATAIMQLVEQERLSLDDKLVHVLPGFFMKDKRHKDITIKHLLTHSSGLMWDNKLNESPDDRSALPLYLEQLKNKRLNFTPGKKMSYKTYSNVAFNLLGLVIEEISQLSFDEYIHRHILRPLNMASSTFFYESLDTAQLALPQIVAGKSKDVYRLNFQGVDRKRDPILQQKPIPLTTHKTVGEEYEQNACGNLLCNSHDLNLWMREWLTISAEDNQPLSTYLKRSMWQEQIKTPNEDISIGLAWWIYKNEALANAYFHVGTNPGYSSILMIYPSQNLGINILCNAWYAKDVIWNDLFDEVLHYYLAKKKRVLNKKELKHVRFSSLLF